MRLPSCFGCCISPLVPPDHTELSRDELKELFEQSVPLNNGRLIVHGIFARADTRNNNRRVYPKSILKREVARFEAEHILPGTALGELDHPNYASRYFKCLSLPNISHQVLEVEWRNDQLWGTIEILSTPSGLLLWELYSQGIKLGVSSRGWASLITDAVEKCVYVDDDFELITFDFVTEPSTRGAYLVPICKAYRKPLPDQSKCTQVGHLGYGVVALKNIGRLPDPRVLAERIMQMHCETYLRCHLHPSHQAGMNNPNGLKAPVATSPGNGRTQRENTLDKLLKFSHYIVHQDAPFLDREDHARDYRAHLSMFATRAHLADQQHGDIHAVIMQEMACGGGDMVILDQQPGQAVILGQKSTTALNGSGFGPLTQTKAPTIVMNDLESWTLHPNALFVDGTAPAVQHLLPCKSAPQQQQRQQDVIAVQKLEQQQQHWHDAAALSANQLLNQLPQGHTAPLQLAGQQHRMTVPLLPASPSQRTASSLSLTSACSTPSLQPHQLSHTAPQHPVMPARLGSACSTESFAASTSMCGASAVSFRRSADYTNTDGRNGHLGGTTAQAQWSGSVAAAYLNCAANCSDGTVGSDDGDGGSHGNPGEPQINQRSPSDAQFLAALDPMASVISRTIDGTSQRTSTAVAVAAGVQTTPTDLAMEFERVRTTLARFSGRYQMGQATVQAALSGPVPPLAACSNLPRGYGQQQRRGRS